MTTITGDKTDETFAAQSGVSYNGQGGVDTLVFSGVYDDYDIVLKGTGNIKTEVTWDGGALDTKWIERFVFADGVYDVAEDHFEPNTPPPLPTISISDGEAVEGQPVTFTISLSHATDHDVTVTYFTQAGTATGMGTDYFGTTGTTVTIPAGQTSVEISIGTRAETLVEPDEQFFVNLSNPVGATIADGQGVGTILNDDVPPPHITMTAVQSTAIEGGTISYLFTRTGGDLNSAFDVTWDYLPPLPNGAATPGVDFVEPASKVIHFAPGQTQVTLDFVTIADGVWEGTSPALPSTEAFAIGFVPDGSYTFTVVSNIATIVDGDAPPPPPPTFISVVATDGVGTEASGDEPDFTFTFTRTGDTSQALTVNYSVAGAPPTFPITFNAAQPGVDIAAQSGTITFAANSATAVLSFNAIDDALVEIDEKFYVTVQPGAGYQYDMFGPNLTAIGTIIDNDVAPPPPTISISDGQAVEGQPVTFTISLSHATDHIVTVTYATQGGTAAGMGNDFFGTPGTTVTIPAGQTSVEISIQTRNDTLVEPNEQFFVNLSNPSGGTIADGQGVGTILNNDFPPPHITMTAVQSAVVEGGTISYLFTRAGGDLNSAFDVTWDYLPPLPNGAATPGVDFVEPASKVVHFAAGQTQATVNFVTIADGVYEGTSPTLPSTEAFAIGFVPDGTYTFTVVSNIATIVDGDTPPALPTISVTQDDAVPGGFGNVVHEGEDVTFTFTRTGSLADELTVEFQINSSAFGSAELGEDFDFLPGYDGGLRSEPFTRPDGSPTTLQIGTVTFAANSATATLTLHTVADGVPEGQPIPPGFDFETFSFGVWPGDATEYLTDLAHSSVSVQLHDTLMA